MQREKEIHEIEVHVSSLCLKDHKENIEILIGKRANDRLIFPSYWECGGGQVHKGETFLDAVKFHMDEEFGLQVDVLFPFRTYSIDLKNKMIPGIRFVCSPCNSKAVQIDHEELVNHQWVTLNQLDEFELIPGLKNDIEIGCNMYKTLKNAQQLHSPDWRARAVFGGSPK
jgi:isopentenyldiphosphate isomerase